MSTQTQIAILAGGMGTRLRPLTDFTPKSMIRVLDKPFLQYQIEWLRMNGVRDIVLCVGHLSEQIEEYFGNGEKHGVTIRYSYDGSQLLGTAGALKKAEEILEDKFGVMNGDSFLPISLRKLSKYFDQCNSLALILAYKNKDKYDKSNLVIKDGHVVKYDRKRRWPGMAYIDYGLSFFRKKVLELVPPTTFYDLDGVYQELINLEQLSVFLVRRRFYEIGSFEGLKRFEEYVRSQRVQPA